MIEEVLFAGFGGQGIMYMGKLLALSAMKEGFEVTWSSSYGIEVRGGTANCVVKISDKPIPVPLLSSPDTFIAMNELSFLKFRDKVKQQGLIIVNASAIKDTGKIRADIQAVKIPLADIAAKAGDHRIANMVALGAYLGLKKIVSLETVKRAMDEMTSAHRRNLLEHNVKALEAGYQEIKSKVKSQKSK